MVMSKRLEVGTAWFGTSALARTFAGKRLVSAGLLNVYILQRKIRFLGIADVVIITYIMR